MCNVMLIILKILLFVLLLPIRIVLFWIDVCIEFWHQGEYALSCVTGAVLYFSLIYTGVWLMSPWLRS